MAGIWLLESLGITHAGGPGPNETVAAFSEENARCRVTGRIFRQETKSDKSYLYLRETELVIQTRRYSIRNIKIKSEKKESVKIGSIILVTGELYSIPSPTNPGQFDQGFYHTVQKIDALMSAETIEVLDGNGYPIRNFLAGIREEMCGFLQREAPREAGVLAAMVLGDKKPVGRHRQEFLSDGRDDAYTGHFRTAPDSDGNGHVPSSDEAWMRLQDGRGVFLRS